MKTYRLKIKPKGSFITPLQADTIFGSLCWIIAQRDGHNGLKPIASGDIPENLSGHKEDLIQKGLKPYTGQDIIFTDESQRRPHSEGIETLPTWTALIVEALICLFRRPGGFVESVPYLPKSIACNSMFYNISLSPRTPA